MKSRRLVHKFALLGGAVFAVLLLVGVPGLGQGVIEPEGELADAECYGHHKQEGFRSMDLFPEVLSQVPKGAPFEFKLTVRNPWLHEIKDLYGYVNISGAPGLSFPGEKEPVFVTDDGALTPAQPGSYAVTRIAVPVEANATELVVALTGSPGPTTAPSGLPPEISVDTRNDFDLSLTSPNGQIVINGPDPRRGNTVDPTQKPTWEETIRVSQQNLTQGGLGEWSVEIAYAGAESPAAYRLDAGVYYNLSRSSELAVPGPAVLEAGEQYTFTFTINAADERALQALRYGGIGVAYHQHTDRNIGDVGNYNKWNTFTLETGDSLIIGPQDFRIEKIDLLGPVFRRWAQVLGFAGSFLIIPSLVFGGTFGRGSVVWLNKTLQSPRRRVLFHNSMSFWLLGVSLLHMFLFLYEAFWNWSHGLVWGGLSLACMIGLGVTGATQRGFVAKWGFARWRFVHFAMGILVVVFVLVHLVADGSHFAFARAWFGADG